VIVALTLNGSGVSTDVAPPVLLSEWLRGRGLTGVRVGCDTSSCGACTVLVDGAAVKSCTVLAVQAAGTEVTTVEGLACDAGPSPVQEAFMAEHALQCGFCTPGFVMATTALLAADPDPSVEAIEIALEGNLCRCTGYTNIVRAVRYAAKVLTGETPIAEAGRAHEKAVVHHVTSAIPSHEELDDTEVV